jgi:ClpP class serine protease
METRPSLFSKVVNVIRSFFWIFLIFLLLYQWYSASSIERRRLSALEAIQGARGTRVITLIHREESVSLLGIPVTKYIGIDDAEAVLRAIRLTPADKPIDIILHTPGGLVLAASQIAHAVQKHKGKITVFVPHYAMSGGTLIALAADKIIMDPNAVLGPVDPQIGDLPAASIIRAVEMKTPQKVDDRTLILADISAKAINQVATLVAELVGKRMPEKEANELAALITTGQFTHDFPITVERAKSVGLPISIEMPEFIYRLMEFYPQRGVGRPSVNYVPMPKAR